jgi:hypothetical protein
MDSVLSPEEKYKALAKPHSLLSQPSTTTFPSYLKTLSTCGRLVSYYRITSTASKSHKMFDGFGIHPLDYSFVAVNMHTFRQPWKLFQIDGCSDSELIVVYNKITNAVHMGVALNEQEARRMCTAGRIRKVLMAREMASFGGGRISQSIAPMDFTMPSTRS